MAAPWTDARLPAAALGRARPCVRTQASAGLPQRFRCEPAAMPRATARSTGAGARRLGAFARAALEGRP